MLTLPQLLKKVAILTLVLIGLITSVFMYSLGGVKFDYDFEKFFPESDPDTEYFNEFRKKFETDNDFVLIGIVNQNGIYKQDFLIKVDSLTRQLGKIRNITQSVSIANFQEPIYVDFTRTFILKRLVHPETDTLMQVDSARISKSKTLINSLVSADGKSLCIFLKTTPYLSKSGSDSLANDINNLLEEYSFDELHVAGRSTGQSYYVKLMQGELLLFLITSFVLVVFFLALSFKSWWGVLFPVLVVLFSIIWTVGVMSFQGEGISLVQTVLPTILFVVGMSDAVHILSKYIEELRAGEEKIKALKNTFRDVAIATFLTSFTTAIGFLTLMFVPIEPVREFGLYTSLGILFAYVLSFTLLPAILILFPKPKIALKKEEDTLWPNFLSNLFLWIIRNRRKILVSSTALIFIAGWACTQLQFNNFLVEDLKDSDPMKKNFTYFENNFAGARPFEMGLHLKNKKEDGLSLKVLKQLEKIEFFLEKNYGTGFVISPLTIIKNLNKSLHTGSEKHFKLPETEKELKALLKKLKKYDTKKILNTVITGDHQIIRISGKTSDLGSAVFREKNIALDSFMRLEKNAEMFEHHLTGTAILIDKNNQYLASNLIYGLIVSALIISLITALMFNFSLKMVLISLLPNILPIVLIGALMALFGVTLKVSTSMIFSISFGIAVDDTIHFLSRLRIELSKGNSYLYSIKRTYLSTGKAIILTTVILSGGFLTLVFSSFLGTFYIGLLIGLTLIFAVICDMLYLPTLLWYFKKPDKK